MIDFFVIVPVCSLVALGFALILVFKILKGDEGTDKMKEIASAVREGAAAGHNKLKCIFDTNLRIDNFLFRNKYRKPRQRSRRAWDKNIT